MSAETPRKAAAGEQRADNVGESISERSWAAGWNAALDRVAKSREVMNAAGHPGAFASACRALKVKP